MRRAAPEIEPIVAQLRAAKVSAPYASQIARGKRTPSREMALRIFNSTGLKFGFLKEASAAEIRVIQRVEDRAAA